MSADTAACAPPRARVFHRPFAGNRAGWQPAGFTRLRSMQGEEQARR
jgi:hypothetical protein